MTKPDCLECVHVYHCALCQGCGPGLSLFEPREAYDQYSPRAAEGVGPYCGGKRAVEDAGPYSENDSEERET